MTCLELKIHSLRVHPHDNIFYVTIVRQSRFLEQCQSVSVATGVLDVGLESHHYSFQS